MCPLVGYVFPHTGDVGLAYAESRITSLPGEVPRPLSHPARRLRLDSPHRVRERHRGRERQQHVNVIGHAVYDQRLPAQTSYNPSEVGKQLGTNRLLEQGSPVLRRKHDVNQDSVQSLRHDFLPPFQGSTLFFRLPRVPPLRLHPRLNSCRRFAALHRLPLHRQEIPHDLLSQRP